MARSNGHSLRDFIVGCVMTMALWPCVAGAACQSANPVPGVQTFYSSAWGITPDSRRFQSAQRAGIDTANVGRLELLWAYGFSNRSPRSYPLVTEDTIFIGDEGRGLVALDRATGCDRWVLKHSGQIASAILYRRDGDRVILYYADRSYGVFAVDAASGTLLWNGRIEEPAVPMYSGTPLVHDDRIYVPISSVEIGLALNPFYGCCTTRGGVGALDATTGKELWYRPTIEEQPVVTGSHWFFVQNHAPSGAPVWAAPTLDAQRDILYFGTGQNYSRPTTRTSDAIFAVDAADGEVRWIRQFTEQDAYNISCDLPLDHPNCPRPRGPDLDFGAPPVLARTPDGRRLVVVGQKSGDVYAMDADEGAVVWHTRIGRGGALGGVHWGMAFNESLGLLYVPVSDIVTSFTDEAPAPGMYALDIATGAVRWSHERTARCADRLCSPGISAAIVATPDLVFSGSLDGFLEAYDASTGQVLWSDDTWREFAAINGVATEGGGFDAHGPMVAGDQLIVSSGYQQYEKGGNALLVYQLEARDE